LVWGNFEDYVGTAVLTKWRNPTRSLLPVPDSYTCRWTRARTRGYEYILPVQTNCLIDYSLLYTQDHLFSSAP